MKLARKLRYASERNHKHGAGFTNGGNRHGSATLALNGPGAAEALWRVQAEIAAAMAHRPGAR